MTRISPIVLFVVLGIGLLTIAFHSVITAASPDQPRLVTKWEHMAMPVEGEKLSIPEISRKIIAIGQDGWELVDVETFVKGGNTNKTVYFFKRPKQ